MYVAGDLSFSGDNFEWNVCKFVAAKLSSLWRAVWMECMYVGMNVAKYVATGIWIIVCSEVCM